MTATGAPDSVRALMSLASTSIATKQPQPVLISNGETASTRVRVQVKDDDFPPSGVCDSVPARVRDTRAFEVVRRTDPIQSVNTEKRRIRVEQGDSTRQLSL